MSKSKLILIACFCAALLAGVAAGVALRCAFGPPPRPPSLEEQLRLTEAQREQMRQIWSGVMRGPGPDRGRREELQKERDAAVAALLDENQKTKYEEVMKAFSDKIAALETEHRSAVEEAVKRTREILTPQQRAKYDELLKQRAGPHGPRGRPGGPGGEGAPPPGGPPHAGPQE